MTDDTVRKLRSFCEKKGISTTGAIAITIHRNRTGDFASIIANFDDGTVHTVYPQAFNKVYNEGPVNESEEFLYCYQAELDTAPLNVQTGASDKEAESPLAFCCGNLVSYRPIRTQNDRTFEDFVRGFKGDAPGLLFEVKRQVDNGPLISTAFFELRGGQRIRVEPTGPISKIHSFKNYKCSIHNRFFGVDLYKNLYMNQAHHMRCIAFAKRDTAIEDAFFEKHGC